MLGCALGLLTSIIPNPFPGNGLWACQDASQLFSPTLAGQLMSDRGAGTWPIKSCQLRKQVGAWWTVARHRGDEMATRALSGLLLCGVAVVFLVLLQGAQSVYIQVCPEGPHGEGLGWRGNAGQFAEES